MAVLREKGVWMLSFGYAAPKRHILAQNSVFDAFYVDVRGSVLAVGDC